MNYTSKILSKFKGTSRVNNIHEVRFTRVLVATVVSETSRTLQCYDLRVFTYINGLKFKGFEIYRLAKLISLNKKNPLESKIFKDNPKLIDKLNNESFNRAFGRYLTSLKDLTGRVVWFNRSSGDGGVRIDSLGITVSVYACNLKGKKTWYAETACTYLDADQEVLIDELAEVSGGVTAIISQGIKFDKGKWDGLDQNRLAFKCNDEGDAINGLFASEKES